MLFNTSPCFLGIILVTLVSACSSQSQGILSKNSQKPATSSSQVTLVNSNQTKTCLNGQENQTNDCPQWAVSANEQSLDQVYRQLVSQLGGASREKLINSQLAWETFVEAQCSFETRGDSSISSSVGSRCLDTLTQQRIQDLKRYLTFNQ